MRRIMTAAVLAALLATGCAIPEDTATPTAGGDAGAVTETTKAPEKKAEKKEPAKQEGPATKFGDGTYEVGKDIAPGTYRSPGPTGSLCYWERTKDFSGELGSIIANENVLEGPARVTIKKSDKGFSSQGCGTWERQ